MEFARPTLGKAVFLVHVAMFLPLSLHFGSISDKPLDLVYSDVVLVLAFLVIGFKVLSGLTIRHGHSLLLMSSFSIAAFFLAVGLVGSSSSGGGIVCALSAGRFVRPFLFVVPAYTTYILFKPSFEDVVMSGARVAAVFVCVLLASDVLFNPGFPNSRWGGKFFHYDIYGFPNSSAVFFSLYVFFLALAFQMTRGGWYLVGWLAGAALVVFTFSRSGWVTLIVTLSVVISVTFLQARRAFVKLAVALLIAALVVVLLSDKVEVIVQPWMYKVETVGGREISFGGRRMIWESAVELIIQRPVFGYMFEPFSRHVGGYDTPHQQYLEVAYKSGIVGLVLYLGFYIGLGLLVYRCQYPGAFSSRVSRLSVLSFFLGVLVSNLAQPNFSFSLVGNGTVFYLSLFYFAMSDASFSRVSSVGSGLGRGRLLAQGWV